eukprot:350328-Lingulodinium_polyedra.AAC.1
MRLATHRSLFGQSVGHPMVISLAILGQSDSIGSVGFPSGSIGVLCLPWFGRACVAFPLVDQLVCERIQRA